MLTLGSVYRIVFTKEMRELLRDRKTLFWLLAPPIILPAIALIAAIFIGSQTARYVTQGFPVTIVNGGAAPGLLASLKRSNALIVTESNDPNAAQAASASPITLIIPDSFQHNLETTGAAHMTLIQHDSAFSTTLALGAVRSEITGHNNTLVDQRLQSAGHDRAWLSPITVEETQATSNSSSVASQQNALNTGVGAIFLPLALTSWLIGGGLGLIVDTTVGEKERQTIESLLVTPASRVGMVLGKLTAVFIASLVVMGMWLAEGLFLSVITQAGPQLLGAQGISASEVLTVLAQSGRDVGSLIVILMLLFIPFVIVLNGLVMAFCSVASSYRESNGFLFLLQLALPAMVLLSIFSIGPDAGAGWYAAPILGTIIAIRDLFSQTLSTNKLLLSVGSTSFYAVLAIALVSYIYSREWALSRR